MKNLLTVVAALLIVGCGTKAPKTEKARITDKEFLAGQPDGIYARIETNRGDIYAMLDHKQFPLTVANFVSLAEGRLSADKNMQNKPFYDSITFHRIIPGFMIQGGCPIGNGMGGPGYQFPDEFDPGAALAKNGYRRGILAMANSGPNTNGSQFFIMHQDYGLPYNYSIFGRVVKGIEVVDSIALSPRGANDRPLVVQLIRHVKILRKGKEAEAFDAPKVFESEKVNLPGRIAARARVEEAAKAAAAEALLKKFANAKTTPDGLKYVIEKEGRGNSPRLADQVTVNYRGMFTNGKEFDSNSGKGPVTMPVTQFMWGWQEGLKLMKPGGKAMFYVPYKMAYGEEGHPSGIIPPKTDLIFEIELLKVN